MPYTVKTIYNRGFVVEELSNGTEPCESWVLLPAENLWNPVLRGFLYVICISYFFVGIAIASDIFMSAIEVITSKKRKIVRWDKQKNTKVEYEVLLWNETVANLTLMALGSSAPEILLATIETLLNINQTEPEDSLGTFTIIGSAAFNLLVITSICIVSVPAPNPKYIREFSVFLVTATWSIWAYVWMLLVVKYITPDVITPYEAWITLLFMPVFVFMAYCQHNGWWCKKTKVDQGDDDVTGWCPCMSRLFWSTGISEHMRIVTQRGRAGSFTGHIIPGKELRVLEAEKEKGTTSRLRSDKDPETVIEMQDQHSELSMENHTKAPQSYARARIDQLGTISEQNEMSKRQKISNIEDERYVQSQTTRATARFRHAVVRSLTGQGHKANKRSMADIVNASMKIEKNKKEGKKPEGDLLGKFTFTSDRYAVLESGGFLEVDILFHRNIPASGSQSRVANGDAVTFKNGNVRITPDTNTSTTQVSGVVSVEYETREGTAKHGKDFKYTSDKLIFNESEYQKTVSIPIINDNQFENDVTFYIVLKNASDGAGIGDPSVANVTIVDDDEPGEFGFEQDHCIADLSAGMLITKVIREHGFDGIVKLEYATIDGTACGGPDLNKNIDYVSQKGVLEFNHAETSKVISIKINKNAQDPQPSSSNTLPGPKNFIITLKNPSLGAKISTRSAVVCNITKDELGDRLADIVEPQEEEQTTWRGQFVSAMQVGGGTDDDGNDVPASAIHYVLHFLTFFWKILGACVPPTKYLGAWPTFWLSLLYIGLLVLVVEQLGHLIGCVVGLPISVTGITIIALGTSLPDTFASRTAAQQDEYADAAIGNVTGSNCVNVFLGLGIPWVLSAMYHLAKGTEFKLVGGELGGKNAIVRWGSSLLLFLLWVLYIVLVSLKATDKLKWEI